MITEILGARKITDRKISFMGNSLVSLDYNVLVERHYARECHWSEIIKNQLACPILNVGIGGASYIDMLNLQLPKILSWQPDICIIGTEATSIGIQNPLDRLDEIVTSLRNASIIPVIMSSMPIYKDNAAFINDSQMQALYTLISNIENYVKRQNAYFIDNWNESSFKTEAGAKKESCYSVDKLHLSPEGNMIFAVKTLEKLSQILEI